eukprot:8810026-Pyramimonas_sp.AAC.1
MPPPPHPRRARQIRGAPPRPTGGDRPPLCERQLLQAGALVLGRSAPAALLASFGWCSRLAWGYCSGYR